MRAELARVKIERDILGKRRQARCRMLLQMCECTSSRYLDVNAICHSTQQPRTLEVLADDPGPQIYLPQSSSRKRCFVCTHSRTPALSSTRFNARPAPHEKRGWPCRCGAPGSEQRGTLIARFTFLSS